MSTFYILIQANDEDGHIFFREEITTKGIIELYSKMLITNARLNDTLRNRMNERLRAELGDDIPF